MASVVYPDGSIRHLKNLGWLLRHWKEVDHFAVFDAREEGYDADALLIAHLTDGRKFKILFADKSVLWNWLKRPVFLGLNVYWFGNDCVISKEKQF